MDGPSSAFSHECTGLIHTSSQLGRLKALAERQEKKESVLLREALDELLRKYDRV